MIDLRALIRVPPLDVGMTEPKAAEAIGIHPRTLRRWRKAGAVGYSLTPGGRVLYTRSDLQQLRDAMKVAPMLGPTAGHT